MSLANKITDAEFEVMKVIWAKAPLTGSEVVSALEPSTGWKSSTILTMVRRLVAKRVLSAGKSEKGILYSPLITRDEYVAAAGASFVDRFFDGALMPMLVHFTKTRKLSPTERAQLLKLLDQGKGDKQ